MPDQLLLEMPGLERVHHAPFLMPRHDAPDADWRRALARMNAVHLTVDQFERGLRVYRAEPLEIGHLGAENARMAALISFCAAEGIEPAQVAAHAIAFRQNAIHDVASEGVDFRKRRPFYEMLITDPIDVERYTGFDDEDGTAC
ncbi:MAG: hypothetical protein EOO76_03015 [Novosphingobium sp.]|nr:MAG: hypothetical protein EOO76_03015 [Novosphingobium sp.]